MSRRLLLLLDDSARRRRRPASRRKLRRMDWAIFGLFVATMLVIALAIQLAHALGF